MKNNVRRQLERQKRRRNRNIKKQKKRMQSPMLRCPKTKLELSEKTKAVNCGGLTFVQQMVRQVGLAESINRHCPIFKVHLPYTEADHVLNIAYNILAGGTCLEHIELRRNDEAYINLLGAERIPDPTTAGDFCRRFSPDDIDRLMDAINESRIKVWQQQPDSFFDLATIEADSTMVETTGEKKEGIGINYKKQWGYQTLALTLANTREQLFLLNRPGNRPSHEGAAAYFDKTINICRRAGFRKVRLRGDTDFSQTQHLDRWHDDGVEFIFGCDAAPNLVNKAENLDESAWKPLQRKAKYKNKSGKQRARRANHKEKFVVEKEYRNRILEEEAVAEFLYRPTACSHFYRMIVVRKTIRVMEGQKLLFQEPMYFFYITNIPITHIQSAGVVTEANLRCDQENIIAQGKEMGALAAPLHDLTSNWVLYGDRDAGMEPEVLVESFTEAGRQQDGLGINELHRRRVFCEWDFSTFRQELIYIPTQIIRRGRQLICRLLQWTPSTELIFLVA